MKPLRNPFITSGYESAEYFCDREQESENLIREVTNGNNLALISTRRMGKTGLIQHCFNNPEIKGNYYTFFVDIYATKSLRDLVFSLSRVIVDGLKPFGKKAIESFWNSVKSLQGGITFDPAGNPSFNLQRADHGSTEATLDGDIPLSGESLPSGNRRHRRISAGGLLHGKECGSVAAHPHTTLSQRPFYLRRQPAARHGQYVRQRLRAPFIKACR